MTAELEDEKKGEYQYLQLIIKRLRSRFFLEQRLIGMADLKAKVASAAREVGGAAAGADPVVRGGSFADSSSDVAGSAGGGKPGAEVTTTTARAEAFTTGVNGAARLSIDQPADPDAESAPPTQLLLPTEPRAQPRVEPSPHAVMTDVGAAPDAQRTVQSAAHDSNAAGSSTANNVVRLVLPSQAGGCLPPHSVRG